MTDPNRTIDDIDIQYIKGVGEIRGNQLKKYGISNVQELLNHIPRRYLDRRTILKINQISEGEEATIVGRVVKTKLIPRPPRRLIVTIYDKSGLLEGVWFNQADFFAKIFEIDQEVAFSGKIGFYKGWQIIHPDFDIIEESKEQLHTGQIISLYPSTHDLKKCGLSSHGFRRIIYHTLEKHGDKIPEILPEKVIKKNKLLSRKESYHQIHFPESIDKIDQPLQRLKYEELFYFELLMALRHFYQRLPVQGITMVTSGEIIRKVLNTLSYDLTGAQKKVLREIYDDLKSGHPMNRLLQGDVGSGKTLVAMITALIAIENGYQVALMAPTEILAEQHFINISDILLGINIRIQLLIGSLKSKTKVEIQKELSVGNIDLVIGTHALVQEAVEFKRLGLVIIDEQHRFGVLQRGELINKGWNPHVLVMTATPIPRTLTMTLYGDLDSSIINEMPPGRQPIVTVHRNENKLAEIYKFIHDKINSGEQAYIVYPLVEESEKIDLNAATESYEYLQKDIFPEFKLALLHGRTQAKEKEKIMHKFKNCEIQILVSTTVIEVGVDIPNATILLINHAERFGLNQLHQLRGRIGRGRKKSYCILIIPSKINEIAKKRVKIMEKINDGFLISEEDLHLRGSGEFFGTRQHGMPDLRFVDLVKDQQIIQTARKDAFEIIKNDPQLRMLENKIIRSYFKKNYAEKFKLLKIS